MAQMHVESYFCHRIKHLENTEFYLRIQKKSIINSMFTSLQRKKKVRIVRCKDVLFIQSGKIVILFIVYIYIYFIIKNILYI